MDDFVYMIVGSCTTYGSFHKEKESEAYAAAIRAQNRGLECWVEKRRATDS